MGRAQWLISINQTYHWPCLLSEYEFVIPGWSDVISICRVIAYQMTGLIVSFEWLDSETVLTTEHF